MTAALLTRPHALCPRLAWRIPPFSIFMALLLTSPGLACHPRGYNLYVSVTVPPNVQSSFSLSDPGLVVAGSLVMGRLCGPSSVPLTFHTTLTDPNMDCADRVARNDALYGQAFAVYSLRSGFSYATEGDRQATLCGESGDVRTAGDGLSVRVNGMGGSVVPPDDRVASGSAAGHCNADGNYVLDLTVFPQLQRLY
jgi:hypothetical protein